MSSLSTLLPIALGLIQQTLPFITGKSAAVGKAIEFVVDAAPVVMATYQDLKPMVANIVVALKADPSTTTEQLAKLEAAEALLDADFDAAAAAAEKEDDQAGEA